MMDEVKTLLRYAFQTRNDLTSRFPGRVRWAWRPVSSIW